MIDSTLCRNAKTFFRQQRENRIQWAPRKHWIYLQQSDRTYHARASPVHDSRPAWWIPAAPLFWCWPPSEEPSSFTTQGQKAGSFLCVGTSLYSLKHPSATIVYVDAISSFIMAWQWWWSNTSHYRAPSKITRNSLVKCQVTRIFSTYVL